MVYVGLFLRGIWLALRGRTLGERTGGGRGFQTRQPGQGKLFQPKFFVPALPRVPAHGQRTGHGAKGTRVSL